MLIILVSLTYVRSYKNEDCEVGVFQMWLKLDLDGIIFQLQIRGYCPSTSEDWDSQWCSTSLSLASRNWLNYMLENNEVILASEVKSLAVSLEKLLNDGINEISEIECIEPDFKFILYPKKDLRNDPRYVYVREGHEIEDVSMEWIVSFWNGGLTNNYLSMEFDRDDIEYLVQYLNMIIGNIDKQSEAITDMINKGLLYG